jgi:transposase
MRPASGHRGTHRYLRRVVDAMLYVFHEGCQWRYLPDSFGPCTRVWSQLRRWSRNGTWARALTVLARRLWPTAAFSRSPETDRSCSGSRRWRSPA